MQLSSTIGDHPVRALLVDHDLDTRRMYAEFLQLSHYEVDEAEDGREALAKALTTHPDAIITETSLPGISGVDLCRVLREDALTRDIPIIFVTADAFAADVERARAAGAHSVLIKPCLPARLASELKRVLTKSHELPEQCETARTTSAKQRRAKTPVASTRAARRPVLLSDGHGRRTTNAPPLPPPALVCPSCDRPLRYVKSHLGGVNPRRAEQWDDFECVRGCGAFQYRQRTRHLRRVT